ncbi:MAG: MFS transporter [Gammaproteobacteria bacterium]
MRHSLRDGMFYSAMIGSAESYFTAFAVLLKAGAGQIALLASLPPLLGALTQLTSDGFGRLLRRRRAVIVFGALLQAAVLLPLALLPLVLPDLAVPLLIACAVVYFAGPNLGSPQWGSLMGDLVPESHRGRFFARRTRVSSLAHFTALIVAGLLLEGFDALGQAYGGFVAIFTLAIGMRLASAWHLHQMYDPPAQRPVDRPFWRDELRHGLGSTGMLPFTLFFASMQFAVAIASPFFALYMLRDLQWSYVAFMFNTAMSVCVQFLTLKRWGRLSDLYGNRLILVTTGSLIPLMPIAWLLSPNYVYLLGVQAVSGALWAGFTLGASNFLFDVTPRDRRTNLMAVHNVIAASAVFLGAVLGGWLGTRLPDTFELGGRTWTLLSPLYGVFLLSALARVTVALIFLPRLSEVRGVRPMTSAGLLRRVTGWRSAG